MTCTKCGLHKNRKNIVDGKGSLSADILLVGEAPGHDEDEWGMVFIGPSGSELSDQMSDVGLSLDVCRIENVVRCRPPNNRKPNIDEILVCREYLFTDMLFINPKIIVALGNVAFSVFSNGEYVSRGDVIEFNYNGWFKRKVLYAYHPAWVLYGENKAERQSRHMVCVDILNKYKEMI